MKRLTFTLITGMLISLAAISQSEDDSFDTKKLTWFGIDYTHCYFVTPYDFPNTGDLKTKLQVWNDLVLYERAKFIEKTLKGKYVKYYPDAVEAKNDKIDIKSRLKDNVSNSDLLKEDQVQDIINGYAIESGMEGTGLVLIAMSYDKPAEEGVYYVTFFDIATKKIFSTEQMSGKASGFGLRNYWANTFYKVLKQIGNTY